MYHPENNVISRGSAFILLLLLFLIAHQPSLSDTLLTCSIVLLWHCYDVARCVAKDKHGCTISWVTSVSVHFSYFPIFCCCSSFCYFVRRTMTMIKHCTTFLWWDLLEYLVWWQITFTLQAILPPPQTHQSFPHPKHTNPSPTPDTPILPPPLTQRYHNSSNQTQVVLL